MMHPANEPFGIDARYPKPSKATVWFLFTYPICAVAFLVSAIHIPGLEPVIGFAGIAWAVLVVLTIVSTLHRSGYEAALWDFGNREFSERDLARTLPPKEQEAFDVWSNTRGARVNSE